MSTTGIHGAVAVGDPDNPTHVIKPNADGSINMVGGAGDGGPVSVADGADIAEGATDDSAVTDPAASGSVIALLKGLLTGFSPTNIATSSTTVVHSGAGLLHGVSVNTKGTVASAVTIYDNTAASGTKIGTVDSLNLAGFFQFDATFSTGLTVVTTGTSPPDVTVLWR